MLPSGVTRGLSQGGTKRVDGDPLGNTQKKSSRMIVNPDVVDVHTS